ncbi:hypothetical protein EI94DRAFT_308595 [Lactarius quietus]|nr:hypothetical protein EI94DRAFT_308595 [Lactarius quietus]
MASTIQRPLAALYSLPDNYPGSQTSVTAPDDQVAVLMDSITTGEPEIFFPRVNIAQSQDQMDESPVIKDIVGNSSDHECAMSWIEEAHIPMMPCSTGGAMELNTILQEDPQTHDEDERLADPNLVPSSPPSPSQLCTSPDRSTTQEEIANEPYQCSFCRLSFAQPQGLTRHSKDTHTPKNGCEFCMDFAWSPGRRYIYRKHLEKEHSGLVSPSVSAIPIRRRRRQLKHCQKPIARTSAG